MGERLRVVHSRSVVSNSLGSHGLQPARLLCPWDSPGKNTGAGCHALLQGIFPTQGSDPGLAHGRQILYQLSHWEAPVGDDDGCNTESPPRTNLQTEVSKMGTCGHMFTHACPSTCAAHVVMCVHPVRVAVFLCTSLCGAVTLRLEELIIKTRRRWRPGERRRRDERKK